MSLKYYILIFTLSFGFSISLFGQTEKGLKMIGGHLHLNYSSSEGQKQDSKSFGYSISPSYSYFINDRLALGGTPYIAYTHTNWSEDQDETIANFHWFGFTPTIRYYLWDFVFSDIRIGGRWSRGSFTTIINGSSEKMDPKWSQSYLLGFGVGTNYFINDHIIIESRLFHRRRFHPKIENVQSNNPLLQFSLGLQILID